LDSEITKGSTLAI